MRSKDLYFYYGIEIEGIDYSLLEDFDTESEIELEELGTNDDNCEAKLILGISLDYVNIDDYICTFDLSDLEVSDSWKEAVSQAYEKLIEYLKDNEIEHNLLSLEEVIFSHIIIFHKSSQ